MATIDTLQLAIEKLNADLLAALQGLGATMAGAMQAGRGPAVVPAGRAGGPPGIGQVLGPVARLLPPDAQRLLSGLSRTMGSLGQAGGSWSSLLTGLMGRGAAAGAAAGVGGAGPAAAGAGAAGAAAAGGAGVASGAAALASNPVGWIVAAAAAGAALVAAFVLVPPAIKDFTKTILESQRHLADASGAMAAVMAQSDLRTLQRDLERGNRQARSAQVLASAWNDLADATLELEIVFAHAINVIGAGLAKTGKALIQDVPVSDLAGLFGLHGLIAAGLARLTGTTLSIEQIAKVISRNIEKQLPELEVPPVAQWLEERAVEAYVGMRLERGPFGAPRTVGD